MSISLLKTVNFGIDFTGLTTIGYTLINDDGSEKQPRTTSGVFEIKDSGIYASYIQFDQNWNGIILWDTGDDEPIYASEEYNDSTSDIINIITDINSKFNNLDLKCNLMSDDLKRVLGLVHENIFIDLPMYDDQNNLIQARLRIYSDSESVGKNENILGTYVISSVGDGPGKFTIWKQERIS